MRLCLRLSRESAVATGAAWRPKGVTLLPYVSACRASLLDVTYTLQ